MILRLAFAAALICTPLTAQAAPDDWVTVGESEGTTYLVRERDFGYATGIVDVWAKAARANGGHDMDLWRFDCARRMYAILATHRYAANGRKLRSHDFRELRVQFTDVVPESVAEGMGAAVCDWGSDT